MNRPHRLSIAALILALLALTTTASIAQTQEPPATSATSAAALAAVKRPQKTVSITVIALDDEAEPFLETLETALIQEFKTVGFLPLSTPEPGAEQAKDDEPQARWIVTASCLNDRNRLVWKILMLDSRDGAMMAAVSGAAFAGISALSQLEGSAAELSRSAASRAVRSLLSEVVNNPLRFQSSDEGASLRLGTLGSTEDTSLGVFIDGALGFAYEPFETSQALVATVSKPGYWTHSQTFAPDDSELPIHINALMLKTRYGLSVGTAPGRIAGLSAEYRYFMIPDALFWRLGMQAWSSLAVSPNAQAILHDEFRLNLGSYVLLPRDSRFRLAVGSGVFGTISAMLAPELTRKTYFDLGLDAAWFSIEWHWPRMAIYLEERASYSLGLESGLLGRGWLKTGSGPMLISAGVIFKWQ